MMKKRNDCIQYLDEIIGKAISAMGRAANMLWIGIGKICDDKPHLVAYPAKMELE